MPLTLAILVLAAAGFVAPSPAAAAEKPKPFCTVKIMGMLWPDEANRNNKVRREAAQSGELEMCGIGGDRYQWQFLSVNVRQLRAAGCCRNSAADDEADDVRPPDDRYADDPEGTSAGANRPHNALSLIRRILGI